MTDGTKDLLRASRETDRTLPDDLPMLQVCSDVYCEHSGLMGYIKYINAKGVALHFTDPVRGFLWFEWSEIEIEPDERATLLERCGIASVGASP